LKIGYACQTVGVPETGFKSCLMKNTQESVLLNVIEHNLDVLERIIDYNRSCGIQMFRISSDLIPFGSSPANKLKWWELFASKLSAIGKKIVNSGIRISMHPGQYTVLNSPNEEVVERAVDDLIYHDRVLTSLGAKSQDKIVLHIGGVYGEKEQAILRFQENYSRLNESIRQRLVIENDERCYTIEDVLQIGTRLNIPVIFDNLHNAINSCDAEKSDSDWITACAQTWGEKDGRQKIHYAQQDPTKRLGAHSSTIRIGEFAEFYKALDGLKIDIMLEVKDKNLSAVKCINCVNVGTVKELELEWAKYKYKVLENEPADYLAIRELLKNKEKCPAIAFYQIIEHALATEVTVGNATNTALHLWGYFKQLASNTEKNRFFSKLERYQQGTSSLHVLKACLWKMAVQYQQDYLLASYYFVLE